MTKAVFKSRAGLLTGFEITGHTSNYDSEEGRLVCAAISSAAYMTVNTITDIFGDDAAVSVDDACMKISVAKPDERSSDLLKGLLLHLNELNKQYGNYIKVFTEV